jgi:hypothetical protein
MSIKLSTISNPKKSLARAQSISLSSGAINSLELQVNINEPNQLKVVFNTQLGKGLYQFFLDGDFTGLRLTNVVNNKTVFDMAFIEMPKGRKETTSETGEIILMYESVSSILRDTESLPRQDILGVYRKRFSKNYFPSLAQNIFTWDVVTSSAKKFYSGFGSVYKELNTAIKEYSAFEWREVGIKNVSGEDKCLIEVGNPADRKLKGYYAEKLSNHISLNDGKNINISNLVQKKSGSVVRSLIPRIKNAGGADPASVDITFITSKNVGSVLQQGGFPLVPSGFRVQTISGQVEVYKVVNLSAPKNGYGDFTDIQTPASFNQSGANITEFLQVAYDRTVLSLRNRQEEISYDVDINTPFILPAGEPFKVNYVGIKPNNQKINLQETQYIGSGFTYDISNFITK